MASRDKKNMHFDPKIKELTIQLWLSGKSEDEINMELRKLKRPKYFGGNKRSLNR